MNPVPTNLSTQSVQIPAGTVQLHGDLNIPDAAQGVVIFAHGSGSSRHSPRNRYVTDVLNRAGFATLLMDLLTEEEAEVDQSTGHLRFDLPFLAERLVNATHWLAQIPETQFLQRGYFGASTGAGAALIATAHHPQVVSALVSRGGRPDLAGQATLGLVKTPTLLLVGGDDTDGITMNQTALEYLAGPKQLNIIPGATHLFSEPGTLEEVAKQAREWFKQYLT